MTYHSSSLFYLKPSKSDDQTLLQFSFPLLTILNQEVCVSKSQVGIKSSRRMKQLLRKFKKETGHRKRSNCWWEERNFCIEKGLHYTTLQSCETTLIQFISIRSDILKLLHSFNSQKVQILLHGSYWTTNGNEICSSSYFG